MPLKLVATARAGGDTKELVLSDDLYRVGRRHDNDLRIPERYVSAYHSELRRTADGGYELVDLGSNNGTYLNGARLASPKRIRTGDTVKFGIFEVSVAKHEASAPQPPTGSGLLRERLDASARELEKENARLGSRIASLQDALATESQELARSRDEVAELRSRLAEGGRVASAAEARIVKLDLHLEEVSRNQGRLQAELERERAETAQLRETLEEGKGAARALRSEVEGLGKALARKEAELAERTSQDALAANEEILKLKRELVEAISARKEAEEAASRQDRKRESSDAALKQTLERSSRLEDELAASTAREAQRDEETKELHSRLEEAEAAKRELAARIRDAAAAALADREFIDALQAQFRKSESEAARREAEQVARLEGELRHSRAEAREHEIAGQRLASQLERAVARQCESEDAVRSLRERTVELKAEVEAGRALLRKSEKDRAKLASELDEIRVRTPENARLIDELHGEAAEVAARFLASEAAMLARHRTQVEALLEEGQRSRDSVKALERTLANTRAGLSEALRHAREHAAREKESLLADSFESFSRMEESLGGAIRRSEEIEAARLATEDELNEREERLEGLYETVDGLEQRLLEEEESRRALERRFRLTREGISDALRTAWQRLDRSREESLARLREREELEAGLAGLESSCRHLEERSAAERSRHAAEVAEWTERCDRLREEALSLGSENATLRALRDEIAETRAEKQAVEEELARLRRGVREFLEKTESLIGQNKALLGEREALKAELKHEREALDSAQRRCAQLQSREEALVETIRAAERRIESLRKLEIQVEGALERKRRQGILSRSETFPALSALPESEAAFSLEDLYRKLIARIDLIDDLAQRYANRWRYPRVAEQLALVKSSFLDLLQDHSVRPYHPAPGTELSYEERRRIKLVPPHEIPSVRLPSREPNGTKKDQESQKGRARRSLVVETIRPGYLYHENGKDVILRKAEVIVA